MAAKLLLKTETPHKKLRVFSLYLDLPASVRARWVAATITRLASPCWQTTSAMWKMDVLKTNHRIGQMMTEDAINADVIILAVSSLMEYDTELKQWLDVLAASQTRHPASGLLIGLLGDEETNTTELNRTVKPLIDCAQRMKRDFIWHWMGNNALNDSEWLADRITSLLARKNNGPAPQASGRPAGDIHDPHRCLLKPVQPLV